MAQIHVTDNVAANLACILAALTGAGENDWIVFPEGALSGYNPAEKEWPLNQMAEAIETGIAKIVARVRQRRCFCLFGTAMRREGRWYNSVIIVGPDGVVATYDKAKLNPLDQRHFTAGADAPVFVLGGVRLGVKVCWELLFEDAWRDLCSQGAQIIFHINNAVEIFDGAWRHIIAAHAKEFGVVVCSVNSAAPPATLGSYLVTPRGDVVSIQPQDHQTVWTDLTL